MKISNSSSAKAKKKSKNNVANNNSKNSLLIVLLIVVIVGLIAWVYTMGKKAEETVPVAMYVNGLAKNKMLTADNLVKYEMTRSEFEKYAVVDDSGTKKLRIVKWEDASKYIGGYAAYTTQPNTPVMVRDLIKSRIDNSDSVLYSYPGKVIVTLDVGDKDLSAFKTFLQPGDRINIEVLYKAEETLEIVDEYGNKTKEKVEVRKYETAFPDITLADLLNDSGESILDIYEMYNNATTYQQAMYDKSTEFQDQVEPKTMLLALTPEEKVQYFDYLSRDEVEFRVTLPQRID